MTRTVVPERVAEFLAAHRRAFLFCRDNQDRPIGYAMSSLRYVDDALLFTTYAKSAKVAHLRANSEAACLVLSADAGGPWVSVRGRAVVSTPTPTEIDDLFEAPMADPRVPDSVRENVRDRLLSGKRVFVRLVIDDISGAQLDGAQR